MAYVSTSTLSDTMLTVANKKAEMAFAPRNIFGQLAEAKQHENGVDGAPGSTVNFYILNNMNPALDELSETSDPTPVALTDSLKTVTIKERGSVTSTTEKVALLSSIEGIRESKVPTIVGINMAESTDLLARSAMDAQTDSAYNTYVGTTAKATIATTGVLTADVIRRTRNKLERENVPVDPRFGSYVFVTHPDAIYDLRKETGDASWLTVARYASPSEALQGEIGMFDNFRFISTTNCLWEPNAGVASQTVTDVDGAKAAGATVVDVTSATGIVAGDDITITTGSNSYTYPVVSVASNAITIGKCFNHNGNVYRAITPGLVIAIADTDVVKEGVDVYTSYALGFQAMAYAYAYRPQLTITGPFDSLGRIVNVGWKALHGYGALRDASLHKVFSTSSLSNVA